MEYIEVSAKTVSEAITEACRKLGVTSDRLDYQVIEEGSNGFLGIGSKPAVIKAAVKVEEISVEDSAKNFLNDVFAAMDMSVIIDVKYDENEKEMDIDLSGDDMGVLIGKRGQTLDSLQYLVSLVVNKESQDYIRVKVDTENYRERRKETLENLAKNIAYKVKRTRRTVALEPMNPYERRIIHFTVSTVEGATSSSIGEEPNRRVVISSTNPKKAPSRDGRRKNYNRDNREGGRSGNEHRSGDKPYRKNNNRNGGKKDFNRKDRTPINNEVDTTPVTDVLPKDAESKPLYSKIEL